MNTVEKLNAVIDYIEKHITEELDLNHLAGIAHSSLYDFQRMFMFIAEISIAEYIRKRRLTLAGLDLQHNNAKVIDAALKYGYESPVSFARAFQAYHGVTPSEAKKSDVSLKLFPRLIFQIIVKEVSQMVRADKITVNGKEYEASYFGEQDMSSWNDVHKSVKFWRLEDAYDDFKNKPKTGIVKPCDNYPMHIETGQVFVLDFTKSDNSLERLYYIADGVVWKDVPSTWQIWAEPIPAIKEANITVNGKEYRASYFGERDTSSYGDDYKSVKFFRLEDAYDDFKNQPKTGIFKPYNDYPMPIETEQVFVLDFTKRDDSVERLYYIADGSDWKNTPVTSQIKIE